MYNNLICIIGPDGVGKTTQVNLLIKKFKEEGIDYKYRWLRFHHFLSLPVLALARLMGLSVVKTLNSGEKIGYHYFYKSKYISSLYGISLFIDTVISTINRVYIPFYLFKKNIIYDRFIYDTIIDLTISTRDYSICKSHLGKLFLKLIPQETKAVLLIADEKNLRNRRDDVFYDENLKLKIKLYYQLSEICDITLIDANLPIEDIHKKLLEKII